MTGPRTKELLPRWREGTCDELRALLSKQSGYEHWRKYSGFPARLLKPQIMFAVNMYGLKREFDAIVEKHNPPKPKRVKPAPKPNGHAGSEPKAAPDTPLYDASGPLAALELQCEEVDKLIAWAKAHNIKDKWYDEWVRIQKLFVR